MSERKSMREYLAAFLTASQYPEKAVSCLLSAYDAITSCPDTRSEWESALEAYRQDQNCDYNALRNTARSIALRLRFHPYTAELLLFLCLTRTLLERYRAEGIPEEIFADSVADLRWKLDECLEVYGICGAFVGEWFPGFFRMQRFAIGRLQYEWYPFGHTYEKNGISLKPNDRVLYLHIPRTGTPLAEKACDDSIRRAAEFFRSRYGIAGPLAFVCDSWLLYPPNRTILPEQSNIRCFMERFEIISSGEYGEDHPDLWRLFDRQYTGDPRTLPYDSSLRRAYVDHLMQGGKTGYGVGIFFVS